MYSSLGFFPTLLTHYRPWTVYLANTELHWGAALPLYTNFPEALLFYFQDKQHVVQCGFKLVARSYTTGFQGQFCLAWKPTLFSRGHGAVSHR